MFKNLEELKKFILNQLDELKIDDIISVDISKVSSITDWVIIGTGRSGKHLEASIGKLKEELKSRGVLGININGTAESGWIICDLGNIIIHLFTDDIRKLYNLEELWMPKTKIKQVKEKTSVVKKTPLKKTATTTKKAEEVKNISAKKKTTTVKKSACTKKPH